MSILLLILALAQTPLPANPTPQPADFRVLQATAVFKGDIFSVRTWVDGFPFTRTDAETLLDHDGVINDASSLHKHSDLQEEIDALQLTGAMSGYSYAYFDIPANATKVICDLELTDRHFTDVLAIIQGKVFRWQPDYEIEPVIGSYWNEHTGVKFEFDFGVPVNTIAEIRYSSSAATDDTKSIVYYGHNAKYHIIPPQVLSIKLGR